LIDRAQRGLLDGADQKRIVPLLRTLVWLQRTLLETRIGLAKLRKILFGKRTSSRRENPDSRPRGRRARAGARMANRTRPAMPGSLAWTQGTGGDRTPIPVRKRDGGSKRQLAPTSKSRYRDLVMAASGRRIIRGPSRCFAPMISTGQAIAAPNAHAAGSIPHDPWCACASSGNRWRKSPTTNWSSCAAGLAAPYSWPTCRPRRAGKPMT